MKKLNLIGLAAVFSTTLAFAQPPEEVPPPLPESSETVVTPQIAPAPVAEPKLAAPATPPEDKRIKGMEITPNIRLVPVGYDSINISGAEGSRTFLSLKPGIGISSSFKTSTDKTINFSIDYAMEWREYYKKTTSKRDFDNDVVGVLSMKVNDLISTSIMAEGEFFFKAGQDLSSDNGVKVLTNPTMKFTATKELSFKLGYLMVFVDNTNSPLGPDGQFIFTDPPTDIDEFRRGGFTTNATGFDNFTGSFDELGNPIQVTGTADDWNLENRIQTGIAYAFPTGTSVSFDYAYRFADSSNNEASIALAHYIKPSVSQALPWKGGSISLTDELKVAKHTYALANEKDGFKDKKQTFRNRLTIAASQDINEYMSAEFFWMYQLTGANGDDYAKLTGNNNVFVGMNFKF